MEIQENRLMTIEHELKLRKVWVKLLLMSDIEVEMINNSAVKFTFGANPVIRVDITPNRNGYSTMRICATNAYMEPYNDNNIHNFFKGCPMRENVEVYWHGAMALVEPEHMEEFLEWAVNNYHCEYHNNYWIATREQTAIGSRKMMSDDALMVELDVANMNSQNFGIKRFRPRTNEHKLMLARAWARMLLRNDVDIEINLRETILVKIRPHFSDFIQMTIRPQPVSTSSSTMDVIIRWGETAENCFYDIQNFFKDCPFGKEYCGSSSIALEPENMEAMLNWAFSNVRYKKIQWQLVAIRNNFKEVK